MENVPLNIIDLYQLYKNSKSVKLSHDLEFNNIEAGDLYFSWKLLPSEGIRGILTKSWRFMEFYMPFLLKLIIPLFKKYTNYDTYVFDGNAYANEALKRGANWAVVDNLRIKNGPKFVLVENTRDTFKNLAAFHRKKLNTQFLGITGSCGKSTTAKLINAVLSTKYTSDTNIITQKSQYNCMPWLPQNILNFDESNEIGVIEMAATAIGQIKELCEIVQPHCGLITCIGKAHLKGFKSIEGVLKGKGELFDYLVSVNGHLFKNLNDSRISNLAKNYKHVTTFGSTKGADISGDIIDTSPFLTIRWYPSKKSKNEYYHASTNLCGEYNLDNILSAISVGLYFDVPPKYINEAIQEYEPITLRSQQKKYGTNTIILDSFNANPTSMGAALRSFDNMNVQKKVAIIGDMLELGNSSVKEHRDMLFFIQNMNFDITVFVGKEFMKVKDNNFGLYFSNLKKARQWFRKQNFNNSHILLKASREIGVERILDH